MGPVQGHAQKMIIYLFQLLIPLYVVTDQGHTSRSNQGQGQIEVIFKERCFYVGGLHLNQMHSCQVIVFNFVIVLIVNSSTGQYDIFTTSKFQYYTLKSEIHFVQIINGTCTNLVYF